MKYEIQCVGIGIKGYEEDYLRPFDGRLISITSLLSKAGATNIDTRTLDFFEIIDPSFPRWEEYKKEYRDKSKRQYPPAYKVKITVEVEKISDADSDELWKNIAK
jgi:hypothetical protein